MTDKEHIFLKDIKETGFYCGVNDKGRDVIFEIIKNTDEEWLKENPDATLLIDEWIYDYTDNDDRRIYGTSGNLVALCFEKSTCEVIKITDTAYKIYGNSGQYLIEDKPTYKEQLARKTQECEELESELLLYKTWYRAKHGDIKDTLGTYYKALRDIENIIKDIIENDCYENSDTKANKILGIINKVKEGNNE